MFRIKVKILSSNDALNYAFTCSVIMAAENSPLPSYK